MKQVRTIILILLLAIQAYYPVAIYAYYYANQSYIASVLCENKDQPQLQCKGKCFLKKKLNKAHENEGSKETPKKNIEILEYLSLPPTPEVQQDAMSGTQQYRSHKPNHYAFEYCVSCLRPPCV